MADVEWGDQDEEEDERRWVVIARSATRRELVPGVNEVAAWRADREVAQQQVGESAS